MSSVCRTTSESPRRRRVNPAARANCLTVEWAAPDPAVNTDEVRLIATLLGADLAEIFIDDDLHNRSSVGAA